MKKIPIGLIFYCAALTAAEDAPEQTKKEPPKAGNFALAGSQQPSPLMSFGQNLIGKHVMQVAFYADDFFASKKRNVDINPNIVYCPLDNLAINFNYPYAVDFKQNQFHSSGFEDAQILFEYSIYSKTSMHEANQATVLAGVGIPFGSAEKVPNTGFGSGSGFLGFTYEHMSQKWYAFISDGVNLTASHEGVKFGNQYLYQFGLGRNICSRKDHHIFLLLIEMDGQYAEKNIIQGWQDPNSGGNFIYLTPSLFYSTPKYIFQLGAGFVIAQDWNGNQPNQHYLIAGNISRTFNL